MSGISEGYPFTVTYIELTLNPTRIHIGDILTITSVGFGDTQETSTITIDGVTPEIISWNNTTIEVIMPEVTINDNDYVAVTVTTDAITLTSNELWVLLGGILRFVNPDDWTDILLDLDNGGDGSSQQIWQEQGTMIPLPSTATAFTSPDIVDGESLSSTRLPNKEATLKLLISGDSKSDIDLVMQNLTMEIYKETNCLEYRPERSNKSIYYIVYRVIEAPDIADYFTHKERGQDYAYDVGIKLPCHPWAETTEEEIVVSNNLFSNGSFEQGLSGWTPIITGAGSPTVTIDSTRFILGGSKSCQLLTDNIGGVAGIVNPDFITIDPTKTHNIQIFGWKQSGTIKVSARFNCYDNDGNPTAEPYLLILTDISPAGAAWEDIVATSGIPIILPEGNNCYYCWPDGTKKIELQIWQTGAVGTVSIDGVLLTESEFIADRQLEASLGIVIPEGEVKGHIPALMDMYISDASCTGAWNSNSIGISNDLHGVDYFSDSVAIAVGNDGKILFNNGLSWVQKSSGVSHFLNAVDCFNINHFWVVGATGTILFSSDGSTWSAQSYPGPIPNIANMDLLNWDNGNPSWWSKTENAGILRKHIRGAGNCCAEFVPRQSDGYIDVFMWSSPTVFVDTANTYRYKAWFSSECFYMNSNVNIYFAIEFFDAYNNLKGSKYIQFSLPNTWTEQHIDVSPSEYPLGTTKVRFNVYVHGYQQVWPAQQDELLIYVDDFGIDAVWYSNLKGIHANDENNVIAVGEYGAIIRSTNGGSSWTRVTTNITKHFYSVCGYNTRVIAVGQDGVIYVSGDNGASWTNQSYDVNNHLYGVYILDSDNAWVVGQNGTILKSINNGITWKPQPSPTSKELYSIYAVDDTHIWAVGQDGTLLFSDGTTWVIEGSGTNVNLNSISAYDDTHILSVGNGGVVISGIDSYTALALTDLVVGQSKGFHRDFNPVLDAVYATLEKPLITNPVGQYRRKSQYRAMEAAEIEEWLFNVSKHKGTYLISIGGGINNSVNYDQITLTLQLKDVAGTVLSPTVISTIPASLDLSDASGYTTIGYFREVAMLASKFTEIDIPSSFVSSLAKQANINQSIIITASAEMGVNDRLNIDCITLIPTDESYVILNNWRTGSSGTQQTFMILSSTDELVLSSIINSVESAMVYNPNYTHGSPQFKANPLGINMTLLASYVTGSGATMDYQLSPRLNIVLKYKPRWLLAGT